MTSQAVIGCGFGDEGKGKTVSFLCTQYPKSLVIRFSGGHQAGHQVFYQDKKHVFSNFGSGTLQGCPTYWSKFCTIDPVGIMNELNDLVKIKCFPILYIDRECPVTTPFDKRENRDVDEMRGHGSVGVGVGQTYERESDFYSLLAGDLLDPYVFNEKVKLIKDYYKIEGLEEEEEDFRVACLQLANYPYNLPEIKIIKQRNLPWDCFNNIIYEGSQGLMLDQHFGFFPHVTYANTGIKNIIELSKQGYYHLPSLNEIYYVTRAYLTRHGNGPMPNEEFDFKPNNPYEYNSDKTYQGKFRTAPLSLDLLHYAINRNRGDDCYKEKLVITCLDVADEFPFTIGGKLYTLKGRELVSRMCDIININESLLSYGPRNNMEGI
jgi:adenylosuccinate synthase